MLANFNKALEQYVEDLGYNRFWRWTIGKRCPSVITWLVDRPILLEALLLDAKNKERNDTTKGSKAKKRSLLADAAAQQ